MKHKFLDLPYEYSALEPYIDENTMQIHHNKHHKTYFDKFVNAIEGHSELEENPIEEILKYLEKIPEEIKQAVINNGGGYANHTFFWSILSKDKPFNPESNIGKKIIENFENYEKFKEEFSKASASVFGSGWAWLVYDKSSKKLEILKTKNQDSPLSLGKSPLIGLDIWEHAYYLKYQNKRPEYIEAFFKIINWEEVEKIFSNIKS